MTYCERADIESIYGVKNVTEWADLDRDKDEGKIAARIGGMIVDATGYIDDRFRGLYVLPLQTPASETPRQIKRLCARLAGLYLYEARGAEDVHPETGQLQHRYRGVQEMVNQQIDRYLGGTLRLDARRERNASGPPELY